MSDPAVESAEALYTTAQVADRLQLPVHFIRTAIRSGRIRAYLPAGRRHGYRIPESAIQDFLRASVAPARGKTPDAP